jgi:hypothetical protein
MSGKGSLLYRKRLGCAVVSKDRSQRGLQRES